MTTSEALRRPPPARWGRAASVAAFVGALGALSGQARAQLSDPEVRPTRGPLITDAVRAGDADATAVELNPAQLGLLTSGSLELVAAGGTSESATAARTRRGAGLYWGGTVFGPNALGIGLTGVNGNSNLGVAGHTTFRLAYAVRLGRSGALGAAWGHIWGGALAGTDTFDFGLSIRPGRHLAFGLTLEDAWEPSSLPRLWNLEIAVRPLGTDRLELAIGAAHANNDLWRRFVPRARLSLTLVDGLRLYAEGQRTPVAMGPVALEGGRPEERRVGNE